MRPMVGDTEETLDQRRHPLTGPHLADKAKGFSPLGQQSLQFDELVRRQARFRARWRLPVQTFHTAVTSTFEPLAHGTRADSKRAGNGLLFPTLLMQFPRPDAAAFAPIYWCRTLLLCHASSVPQDEVLV